MGIGYQILKEEIRRVIELEAENAVLQQSLASLTQLKSDRIGQLDLNRSMQVILQIDRFSCTVILHLCYRTGCLQSWSKDIDYLMGCPIAL